MYLILPLALLIVSIFIIAVIVRRKFVYLKKLTPETVEATMGSQESFWAEMFPEIIVLWNKIHFRTFGVNFLSEFEKLLRKFRLISLKIDTLTNWLIHKVRKEGKQQAEILKEAKIEEEKKNNGPVTEIMEELGNSSENLKQKEQLLIIEIAKNPKDTHLYRELGAIYMRMEEWEDAKLSFEKVLDLEPNDDIVKRKLGRVLTKLEEANRKNNKV